MRIEPGHSRWSLSAAGFLLATAGFIEPAWAQLTSTISLDNGFSFSITANLGAPAATEQVKVEMFRASGDSFYRVFKDQGGLTVFAYELEIGRTTAENEFRVTAKLAGDEFAARFPGADGGKPVPTLSTTQEFVFHAGSVAEIGLFALEGQGLKVVDVARVAVIQPGSGEAPGSASDQASSLRFSGLRISINGMPVKADFGGTVVGRYALFYLPGRGAYFFSTSPVEGRNMIKAGSVDHNRLQFTMDNESFECVANAAILTRGDTGEVWVYHDPNYAPAGNWTVRDASPEGHETDRPFTAGADSLQWWLPVERR